MVRTNLAFALGLVVLLDHSAPPSPAAARRDELRSAGAARQRSLTEPPLAPAGANAPYRELAALRHELDSAASPGAALERFVAGDPAAVDLARARMMTALRALEGGDSALARALLEQITPADPGFLQAYARYLLGVMSRTDAGSRSLEHFTAAYHLAGPTLLRYRASLWIAEDANGRGDAAGALALLDAVADSPVDEALACDFALRRALVLGQLGRQDDASKALAELYLSRPLLGYRAATEPLYRILRGELEPDLPHLPLERRVARAEALAELGHPKEAGREAQALLRLSSGVLRDRVQILVARAELSRQNARPAMATLQKIPRSSAFAPAARLLRAQALRQLGKRKDFEAELGALVADRAAGTTRLAAALALARALESDAPEHAAAYWDLVASESTAGEDADEATWKSGWLRYRAGDYLEAAAWFGRLAGRSSEPRVVARGTYWGARSLERAGHHDDALLLLAEAAALEPVGYYGLVAIGRLRDLAANSTAAAAALRTAESASRPAPPADPALHAPESVRAALEPAGELLAMGLAPEAIAELEFQARRFPSEAAPRAMLAEAYHEAGDHLESVRWLRRAFPSLERSGVPSRLQTLLYPLPYWDSIRKNSEAHSVDPYLAAAVIYQESRFRSEARSVAGAVGLMQIMPGTGREIARKLREPAFRPHQLLEPERNIRYGVYYLRRLTEDLGGSAVRALAGYNAGGSRARRWSSSSPDLDEYVEAIPFRETRLYVKNILVAHQGYHRTYDGDAHECGFIR